MMRYQIGDVVSLGGYSGRKVGIVVGFTAAGLLRVRVWQHNSRRWTQAQRWAEHAIKGPAPSSWPQTKAASKELIDHDLPHGAMCPCDACRARRSS